MTERHKIVIIRFVIDKFTNKELIFFSIKIFSRDKFKLDTRKRVKENLKSFIFPTLHRVCVRMWWLKIIQIYFYYTPVSLECTQWWEREKIIQNIYLQCFQVNFFKFPFLLFHLLSNWYRDDGKKISSPLFASDFVL